MTEIDCRKCQNLQTVPGVSHVGRLTACCKCYGPADKAPAACAADRFKNYRPMRTDDEYKPGMDVWCLERNTDDEAVAVAVGNYIFLAKVQATVIVCPDYYDGADKLDTLLSILYEDMRDEGTTGLRVFPACDCYPAEALAKEALAEEMEG
jgi:hypothetical protein